MSSAYYNFFPTICPKIITYYSSPQIENFAKNITFCFGAAVCTYWNHAISEETQALMEQNYFYRLTNEHFYELTERSDFFSSQTRQQISNDCELLIYDCILCFLQHIELNITDSLLECTFQSTYSFIDIIGKFGIIYII